MKARLKIQNFGPIDDLDIEISKFNILIGPHASGKSTIAKVLCVINFFDSEMHLDYGKTYDVRGIKAKLFYYRIESFLKENTYWFFEDERFNFELKDSKMIINNGVDFATNEIPLDSYYFPAERIALPMISESLFEITLAESSLPGYFLKFGKDFTVSRKNQNMFNIPLLDVQFAYEGGRNVVTLPDKKSLLLEETSSAIQANLPLLIILQYPFKIASLLVIEELELHCFPVLQKRLLYYLIERTTPPRSLDTYVILPTHSPYILSSANNLLFAAKVAKQDKETATEVNKIIGRDSWIAKENFSAYFINNGTAVSIVNPKTGLIDENELDGISEDLSGEFDALMDLYKPVAA